MYINQLTLKNIACFANVTLDFTHEGQPCPWVVLLGENGTGKSTILQMLTLALLGRDLIGQITSGVDWRQFVQEGSKRGQVDLIVNPTKQDKKRGTKASYQTRFDLGQTAVTNKTGLRQNNQFAPQDYKTLDDTLYSYETQVGWFACGYGPWRRLPATRIRELDDNTLQRKSQRFITIFNAEEPLTVASIWLGDLASEQALATQAGHEAQAQQAKQSLKWATTAIEAILPGVKVKDITPDRKVWVIDQNVTVTIDQLSDGYRSTLAWVIDLVRRLVETFPKNNPFEAEGVVLVDEIALHLHPQWQRQIVEHIRSTFPNLQFIVTSHSPFIAQDMREEDKIIVLKRGDDGVQAQESDLSVADWRIDQILTSYLFDLATTRNIAIGAMEQEYQQLLDKQSTPEFSTSEEQRLAEIQQWLAQHQAPLGDTPAENEVFDTATSLINLLDSYLKE